jgi:hypothetical protein
MNTQKFVQSPSEVQWCYVSVNQAESKIGAPQPQSNTWVQLLELFNPYSHDEALLLCQISNWEWVAWIPDHGETIVNIEQFCFPVND